jgi:nucleoside-diphosphate-sugar epimerase
MMKVTIAGASGFVGRHLIKSIPKKFHIKGLSRSARKSNQENLIWEETDIFSLHSTIDALKNTDVAIYLVHSMMPSARLFQGNFSDTDILLADNFARACKKHGVKQIIYLGGLVPEDKISKHLESRQEVEEVLKSTGIPLTVLRAGMIVGDGGSSFEMLKNLVHNLPAMILPKWTQSNTQSIYIDDLVDSMIKSIGNKDFYDQTIDTVNGEQLTYECLIKQTGKFLGKEKVLIPIPVNYTGFSKLWVKIFGESDYELVDPLIDSLICDLPRSSIHALLQDTIKHKTYQDMLKQVSKDKLKRSRKKKKPTVKSVRSIQRLPNPHHFDNESISKKYVSWLPRRFRFFITVRESGDMVTFHLFHFKAPLLTLKRIAEDEEIDRVKFHIVGGLLTLTTDTGWLEFRQVARGKFTLSSIHEFFPALPWYIYKVTQAPIHAWVMKSFGKYLARRS